VTDWPLGYAGLDVAGPAVIASGGRGCLGSRRCPVLDARVADVGEHATFGRFLEELGIRGVQENDHRTGGLADDLVDQSERMLRALTEPDERHIGALSGSHGPDV
jgi:hypothetical protein